MTPRYSVILLLAVSLLTPTAGVAQSSPIELQWGELNSRLQGRDIALVLPDGISLRGEVEAVREDSLLLDVRKTSDASVRPKGNALIPRASVTTFSIHETRGRWGRSVGIALGTLSGMALGGYVAVRTARSGGAGLGIFLSIAGAGSVTGYLVGKPADEKTISVRLVP